MKLTERGWGGHFIGAPECLFRRNTLIEHEETKIVVSTVGLYRIGTMIERLGLNRYYETMAFYSDLNDTRYYDANVAQQIDFDSPWTIDILDADDIANEMHDTVVWELTERLRLGELKETHVNQAAKV